MNRLATAAAFYGSAENLHYPVDERLKMALAALGRYEQTVEELQGWCDQQDARSKGESPTTAAIRKVLDAEDT